VVICLGADCLHMVRLMPLPSPNPVISCLILKSRLVLPFWNRLTQVVLEKRPLNGCTSSSFKSQNNKFNIPFLTFQYTQSFHISALFSDSQGCSVFFIKGSMVRNKTPGAPQFLPVRSLPGTNHDTAWQTSGSINSTSCICVARQETQRLNQKR